MSLRPINNKSIKLTESNNKESEEESNDNDNDNDNIIIVAFPGYIWDTVKNIAEKLDITTNEVIGNAIKEYYDRNGL